MSSRQAAAFLQSFRAAQQSDQVLEVFAEDAEGFGAAMRDAPEALALSIAEAGEAAFSAPADFLPGAFAAAACRRDGEVVVDAGLLETLSGRGELRAAIEQLERQGDRNCLLVCERGGRPVALTAAPWAIARGWPLSPEVAAAAASGRAPLVVMGFRPDPTAWLRSAAALGLTPSEARLIRALSQTGDLRAAARASGLTYESARQLVASSLKKTGCSRQTDLVRLALTLAAGDIRPPEQATRLFADLFALTRLQADLARALAKGATRTAAAGALGITDHRAKAELRTVFLACGIANAVDLARLVGEVDALSGLATACHVEGRLEGASSEPLRLVKRSWAPGRICIADHGPVGGVPVVIFHTSTGGRTHSPSFMAAARSAGLRMIAFERAGYGLSDPAEGAPFENAARDLTDVLDALELEKVLVLARGGSTAALTCAHRLSSRVVGGVLLGPDPPADLDRMRTGMMGLGKSLLFGNPQIAETVARMLSTRTSSRAIAKMMIESVRGSAPDEAALQDPAELDALVRGGRQSALGMWGYLREHIAHGAGAKPPRFDDASRWTLFHGVRDPLYHFEDVEAFWRERLPGVRIDPISNGGRFLHITHAAIIIDALARSVPGLR